MACIKSELTLAPSEVTLFLNTVNGKKANLNEIKETVNKPLFKIKSALRELTETNYIIESEGYYVIADKGKTYLAENK